MKEDYYKTLGVGKGATASEIKNIPDAALDFRLKS